jgi:ribonuclease HI
MLLGGWRGLMSWSRRIGRFENRQYERTTLPEVKKSFKGKVVILKEEEALVEARKRRDGLVFWTDGSRKIDEWTGCAVVWKEGLKWSKRRIHLGRQEEAYDVEMYAISEAVKIADEISRTKEVRAVTIFTNSQATLKRIQSDEPGPGQVLALRTMNWESELTDRNIQVEYRWVPAHSGVEGNEKADQQAMKAA